MDGAVAALLWFVAIGCGLVAGVFFAFSAFVMRALARLPSDAAIAAMQAINRVILRSLFIPLFFTTTVASFLVLGIGLVRWEAAGSPAMVIGGALYVLGMFVCTVTRNVPLNTVLAAVDGSAAESGALWAGYVKDWTRWNHVRTLASTLASALFVYALVMQRGAGG